MGVAATVGVSTLNGENNVKDWFISCSRQMVIELGTCSALNVQIGVDLGSRRIGSCGC